MPFVKGDPNINRKGRLDGGGLNITKLLKEKLEEIPEGKKKSYKALFVSTLLHKALIEKDLQSLKLIMNYVDGMPQQYTDITTDGESLNNLSYDNARKIIAGEKSDTSDSTE